MPGPARANHYRPAACGRPRGQARRPAMPVMTTCPQCRQPLRVADDQVGRHVRCPACKTVFAAGIDRSGVHARPGYPADARAAARARTGPPGLGLIVNGLLTALVYAGLIAAVALAAAGQFANVPGPVTRWNERQEQEHWPMIA